MENKQDFTVVERDCKVRKPDYYLRNTMRDCYCQGISATVKDSFVFFYWWISAEGAEQPPLFPLEHSCSKTYNYADFIQANYK